MRFIFHWRRKACTASFFRRLIDFRLRQYSTGKYSGGDPDCQHETVAARNGRGGSGPNSRNTTNAYPAVLPAPVCGKCGATYQDDQLGGEALHDCLGWATGTACGHCYICHMLAVLEECWRVLRDDGTCWVVIADSYVNQGGHTSQGKTSQRKNRSNVAAENAIKGTGKLPGLKLKDLCGIPERLALAAQARGWYWRSKNIWHKPNAMPFPLTDRTVPCYEDVLMFAKSERYFFDHIAIQEPFADERKGQDGGQTRRVRNVGGRSDGYTTPYGWTNEKGHQGKNRRDVWTIVPEPWTKGKHRAAFPSALVELCVKAGTSEAGVCPHCGLPWQRQGSNGASAWAPACNHAGLLAVPALVLDPFVGTGTTVAVARHLGRSSVGCDLSHAYLTQDAQVRLALPYRERGAKRQPRTKANDDKRPNNRRKRKGWQQLPLPISEAV